MSRLARAELAGLAALADPFLVAEERGVPVGYLLALAPGAAYDGEEFAWFRARYGDFLYVDQVAVAEERRGRGVGTLLYRALEARALARGIPRLACEVNLRPPNPASLRFHAELGFGRVGTLTTTDGRRVALLLRELGPGAPPEGSGLAGVLRRIPRSSRDPNDPEASMDETRNTGRGPEDPGDPEIARDAAALGAAGISRSTGTGSAGSGVAAGGGTGPHRTTYHATTGGTTDQTDDLDDAVGPSSAGFGGTGEAGSGLGGGSEAGGGGGLGRA